ncbi:hypothetical protein AERO9A_140251 [Aeromonas salmonicida]|nr:hypothetical protein AERO9A_140251 [Aeromonas salmonicida]
MKIDIPSHHQPPCFYPEACLWYNQAPLSAIPESIHAESRRNHNPGPPRQMVVGRAFLQDPQPGPRSD